MKKIYLLLITLVASFSSQAQDVVISQFFGGNSITNPYNQDFVEVFNKSAATVDVSGWTIQYGAAGATSNINIAYTFPGTLGSSTTVIAPGKYYLVGLASVAGGTSLPTPDGVGATNISGTNGKIAIVKNNTALLLTVTNPINQTTFPNISDFVGYGTSNLFEGTALSGVLGTTIAKRLSEGCIDSNTNSSDFTILTSTTVRNSGSAANICTSAPTIAITSPSNGAIFSPETTNVNIALSISNFAVALSGGDGHIHYEITEHGTPLGTVMKYDTTPIAVPTTPGTYSVYVELVNNSHNPLVPAKNATVTFTVASYTNAATLAAVRAAGINAWVNYTGTSIVSFSRPLTGGRNQKYIQDATAGILVDDNAGLITTPFVIGDGISSIKGQLINFNGVMEFVPNQDATKPSTGNTITPAVVTLATIAGNIDAYESQLVQINGVSFTAADGTAVFAVNTDTAINDGTASLFRPMFPATEVDYIGAVIPSGPRNAQVIVSENNGVLKVVARSLAELTLSRNDFNAIAGLKIYPNPAKNVLNITSDSFVTKNVEIYNVVGAKVLATQVTNSPVNVASLTTGIYMVKVTEDGKTATRKLVIE